MKSSEQKGGGGYASNIEIIYPDGTVERIEMQKIKVNNGGVNNKTIAKTLNEMGAKGYKLISIGSLGPGDLGHHTNYVFIKEQHLP